MADRIFVSVSSIVVSNDFQPRLSLDDDHVASMVKALGASPSHFDATLIKCWRIGGKLHVVDGFHRLTAFKERGVKEITVEVYETQRGTDMSDNEILEQERADALALAVSANNHFGSPLRRSRADNRRAVELLLADPVTRRWSDTRIADMVGISTPTVGTIRKSNPTWCVDERQTANGKKISAQRQGSGTRKAPEAQPAEPPTKAEPKAPVVLDVRPRAETPTEVPTLPTDREMELLVEVETLREKIDQLEKEVANLKAERDELKLKAEPVDTPLKAQSVPAANSRVKVVTYETILAKLTTQADQLVGWSEAANFANVGRYKKTGVITPEQVDQLKAAYATLLEQRRA